MKHCEEQHYPPSCDNDSCEVARALLDAEAELAEDDIFIERVRRESAEAIPFVQALHERAEKPTAALADAKRDTEFAWQIAGERERQVVEQMQRAEKAEAELAALRRAVRAVETTVQGVSSTYVTWPNGRQNPEKVGMDWALKELRNRVGPHMGEP